MAWFDLISKNRRFSKAADRYWPQVKAISALDQTMQSKNEGSLREIVAKRRGQELDELLKVKAEIFAAVREVSRRVLKMRHFDEQLLGGLALLDGVITEMKTGEGKTLVATAPLILRALAGRGAHLVTVNDYLASRDAKWMGPLYEYFGISVGIAVPGMSAAEKRLAYQADITYATNNELGFDYLRDNMARRVEDIVQRELNYAIVDEVDSILIDEARTPLIISAPDMESTGLYSQFAHLVPKLKEGEDYNVDEKRRAVTLTDEGTVKIERDLGMENIYEEKGMRFVHHLEQALRARALYQKDKDYVVKDGQVIIVDEFTGRLMTGRRYSEGLHQAIEAKEGVKVQQESRTLATITFQNFFRLYDVLAGMTGTAATSAEEFEKVYNAEVVVIPTHKPLVRQDKPDRIFVNEAAKFKAVGQEIAARHKKGQPVLVGTIAIEKSEYLSALLGREGVPHEVLNAKNHAREAEIVAKAGHKGAVTISTNMAGRGTDIKLGKGVADVGGLFVLGTERHEARRIDNQLRGRSGRQGDPGETQFFVSLEDDVMRVFGGEKIRNLMKRLRVPEDEPIENRLVTKALEGAQERVEGYYFDMRKQVLSYDDVLNRQRTAIYTLRRSLLKNTKWKEPREAEKDLRSKLEELALEQGREIVGLHAGEGEPEGWNSEEMAESIAALAGVPVSFVHEQVRRAIRGKANQGPEEAREAAQEKAAQLMAECLQGKREQFPAGVFEELAKASALRAIDLHWMEHLDTMDYLRTGIGLRGYGQRDPLVEYQKEGWQLFQRLMGTIKSSFLETVLRAKPQTYEAREGLEFGAGRAATNLKLTGGQAGSSLHQLTQNQDKQPVGEGGGKEPLKNHYKNVGRNDPCPCGSGKKFKKCHGA